MDSGFGLSSQEARWLAVEAQRLGRPRPAAPIGPRHVRTVVESLGTLQLDAINVVARTQFLVVFSRLGAYDVSRLQGLTGPGGTCSSTGDTPRRSFRWHITDCSGGGWTSTASAQTRSSRTRSSPGPARPAALAAPD